MLTVETISLLALVLNEKRAKKITRVPGFSQNKSLLTHYQLFIFPIILSAVSVVESPPLPVQRNSAV